MFRSLKAMFARHPGISHPSTKHSGLSAAAEMIDTRKLNIPVAPADSTDLVGRKTIQQGRDYARQDRWRELSQHMQQADRDRAVSPCGQPIVDLLAFGARSDVVLAAEHALSDGAAISDYDLLGGISELEGEMQDHSEDPMIGLIVALAHIDLAWAWRGPRQRRGALPDLHQSRCAAHFDRAAAILPKCKAALPDSWAIAAADCALLAGQRVSRARVSEKYEDLIALDPRNHQHMRAMGAHLLPRWFGSYEQLEVQALRNAARTQDIWGAGGYTWVQFDAIALDDEACARVDVEYFLEGLHDIVSHRSDQQTVNLLAAYCAITLQSRMGRCDRADKARQSICAAADWLIRDHLTELHPMIWAHAADGFNNSLRVSSPERFAARGQRDALRAIAGLLRDELRNGQSVTFTPSGLQFSGN